MPGSYSRRDFLAGVLATGTLSAAATYFAPGGRTIPPVTLRLVTGVDPTGARDLLILMWNQANPHTTVTTVEVEGSSTDQRNAMASRVTSRDADILNLDIIDIPYFQSEGYIVPVELEAVEEFLQKPLLPSRLGNPESNQYWAAPFNTDVGMLFERIATGQALPGEPGLADVIDGLPDGSQWIAGHLKASSSSSAEAFTINILEHALSRDAEILHPETGMPARELERWQDSLEPLRTAITKGRLTLGDGEEDTRNRFSDLRLPYMRNWPVKYRELQMLGDQDVQASQIYVRSLPRGILGGQSLALVENSTQNSRASEFIRFLTSGPAQKILASYGLAATKTEAYTDPALTPFIPHLVDIRGAIEHATPRPVHHNYNAAAQVIFTHTSRLLEEGTALSTRFVEDLQMAIA